VPHLGHASTVAIWGQFVPTVSGDAGPGTHEGGPTLAVPLWDETWRGATRFYPTPAPLWYNDANEPGALAFCCGLPLQRLTTWAAPALPPRRTIAGNTPMNAYCKPRRLLALVVAIAAALVVSGTVRGQAPRRAGPQADYSAELPRVPLKSPEEALKAMVPRPGFHVELAAAEPALQSPVAIDFDEDSRLYVAEFPEYNQYASAKASPKGCVRRLEDRDGDGRYETSTLFADNLPKACAVFCWDGGVYVGSVPDILYLKDTTGDGKADIRRVALTGFGSDRAGEGMLNSFRWGLDNRIHISANHAGGDLRRGDQPEAKTVPVRGQHLLLDPRGEAFELTGGGGQHGMSMDDWGRTYVCANSDPFHMVMYDSRYLARNPYLQAPPAAVNIAPAGKYTKLVRSSPVEPWRALRTRLRSQGIVPGSDEGGSPSGFFTAATGITVYRGDAYPAEFRGNLFVGDVSNNIVHRALAVPDGLLVRAESAERGREFLASRDNAFRPVQMANGPDGCLWLVDMCRELIEGAAFLPPAILQHMDVTSGIDRGRIWRVVPEGTLPSHPTKLGKATTAELVALLEHPNGWHRDTASRLLYQRQDRSCVEPLRQLAAHGKTPLTRTQALYALKGQGALDAGLVLAALGDADPHAREHALRLAEGLAREHRAIRERMTAMTGDTAPRVRYQLAFSLGALPGAEPSAALAALAVRDGANPWMRMAILSSTTDRAGDLFLRLAGGAGFRASKDGRAFLAALAAQSEISSRPDALAKVLEALDGPLAGDDALARQVVLGLLGKASTAAQARLRQAAGGRVGAIVEAIVADARKTAGDASRSSSARASALRTLRFAPFGEVVGLLTAALESRQPPAVQTAAMDTLARFDDPRVAAILLDAWPRLSPRLRASAAEAVFARPAWIGAFLDAVEKGSIARSDVDPARLELLKTYPDEAVRSRAGRVLSGGLARRQDVVDSYQKVLRIAGDRDRGKLVFKNNCSTCHRLENVGQQVGADLSAIRDRGLDSVLLNILDPNREVKPQYLTYIVVTTEGQVLTGMIVAETANSLTIRKPDGAEETVLRLQVDEMRSTGLSYMPEGLEKQIDPQAMADLLTYLGSVR
jgi:putative membrane-bound dehydrogenase-like protein